MRRAAVVLTVNGGSITLTDNWLRRTDESLRKHIYRLSLARESLRKPAEKRLGLRSPRRFSLCTLRKAHARTSTNRQLRRSRFLAGEPLPVSSRGLHEIVGRRDHFAIRHPHRRRRDEFCRG